MEAVDVQQEGSPSKIDTTGLGTTNYQKNKDYLTHCRLCDKGMVVRILQRPCSHVVCYDCYCLNPKNCKFCGEIVREMVRLNDKLKIPLVKDSNDFPTYKEPC
mmetsp:Transcript_1638/g.1746  ORF Transcript_1638/g.1746 Transcript_1638/m.1746 type:complete len:103 (-) Transcript_1638:74-382(-)